jgi:Leucine-rich repeat (LRR) protein
MEIDTQSALQIQAACQLAQMPKDVIEEIISWLPNPRMQPIARVRQTCKFFYATFGRQEIKIEPQQYDRKNYAAWEKLYNDLVSYMKVVTTAGYVVSLDLSGNRVNEFMFAKHPECLHVARLKLEKCGITMERDNFFDKNIWQNLEEIDLSDNHLGRRDVDLNKSGDWYSDANIWPSLCSLPKLKVLILKKNRLQRVPQQLHDAKQLRLLDLRGNALPQEDIDGIKQALEPATKILVDEPQEAFR